MKLTEFGGRFEAVGGCTEAANVTEAVHNCCYLKLLGRIL
jgi:hypothetical protein